MQIDAKTKKNIGLISAVLGGVQLAVAPFFNWSINTLPVIGQYATLLVGIGLIGTALWMHNKEL